MLRIPCLLEIEVFRDEPISPLKPSKCAEDPFCTVRLPLEHATLPSSNARIKTLSPDPLKRRPPLQTCNSGSGSKARGSLKSPDRFLPNRGPSDAAVQRFRANKDIHKLSLSEKVLRRNDNDSDAFSQQRQNTSPSPPVMANGRRASSTRIGGEIALSCVNPLRLAKFFQVPVRSALTRISLLLLLKDK
jgi:hypothetical protein